MEYAKEVERSLWSGVGAGVDGHEVVGAKGGVVDVGVGERAVVTPTQRVVPVWQQRHCYRQSMLDTAANKLLYSLILNIINYTHPKARLLTYLNRFVESNLEGTSKLSKS